MNKLKNYIYRNTLLLACAAFLLIAVLTYFLNLPGFALGIALISAMYLGAYLFQMWK